MTGLSTASLRTRLTEIDTEVADIYARLEDLAMTREIISDTLKSIVYPILTIPPDITAEIFERCVDSTGIKQSVVLASVCRAWRQIGLSLGSLWSNIRVPAARDTSSAEESMECWIPRAGGRLIDVDTCKTTTCDRLFDVLGPYSTKLRALTCRLNIPTDYLKEDIRGHIPQLKVLNIYFDRRLSSWCPPSRGGPISSFAEAPNLREVSLFAYGEVGLSKKISLPWGQLTHLTCSDANVIQILSLTPNLETLMYVHSDVPAHRPSGTVRLDHLHTLQFDHPNLYLLSCLTLPSLECLTLSSATDHWCLAPFLTHSGCALRSISIKGTERLPWPDVVGALKAVPTVTQVSITNLNSGWDTFFARIRVDTSFLPNLETLCLETIRPQFSLDTILDEMTEMLLSRWGQHSGSSRLESLQLIRRRPQGFLSSMRPRNQRINSLQTLIAERCEIKIRGFEQDLDLHGIYRDPSYMLENPYLLPSYRIPPRYT
ncbi:hypothetical protein DFH06DRAFT_1208427 [Mycena polygramma]|nr:hypothetical protein DFH06DRAFT_1208427 [Mycena polygramma]